MYQVRNTLQKVVGLQVGSYTQASEDSLCPKRWESVSAKCLSASVTFSLSTKWSQLENTFTRFFLQFLPYHLIHYTGQQIKAFGLTRVSIPQKYAYNGLKKTSFDENIVINWQSKIKSYESKLFCLLYNTIKISWIITIIATVPKANINKQILF